jgi:hypothetical protein
VFSSFLGYHACLSKGTPDLKNLAGKWKVSFQTRRGIQKGRWVKKFERGLGGRMLARGVRGSMCWRRGSALASFMAIFVLLRARVPFIQFEKRV